MRVLASERLLSTGSPNPPLVEPLTVERDAGFVAFVRLHQDAVFALAVRLMGTSEAGRDVAVDVLAMAHPHHHDLPQEPARQWLRAVTIRACVERLTRRTPTWSWRRSGLSHEPPRPDAADEPVEPLERAVRRLPDAWRVPCVLFYLERLSDEDIADALGVPLATVRLDVQRGREALGALVSGDGTR